MPRSSSPASSRGRTSCGHWGPGAAKAQSSIRGPWASAGLRHSDVFRRLQVHAGHRLDPAQMVVNFFHTGDVLCTNNSRLPRTLPGNDAAEMHDAVAHDHAETHRAPLVLLQRVDDA